MLGRLAGTSLLTFSVDGSSVTVHRLVMRVIRESLAARGALATVCAAAADALDGWPVADRYLASGPASGPGHGGTDHGPVRVRRPMPAPAMT